MEQRRPFKSTGASGISPVTDPSVEISRSRFFKKDKAIGRSGDLASVAILQALAITK